MKTLTIFTPTFNRAYLLGKCYESLIRQSCKDFIWLIIDDGSMDNTEDLVQTWIKEKKIEIRYFYQENQGMHGAHNSAYKLIDTEINTCIDSDDYMPEDGVLKIVEFWKSIKNKNLAGFVALDAYEDGKIIGTKLPENIKELTYFQIYNVYGVKGDKKLIYRSDLTRLFPYPLFKNEKYVSLSYKYSKLDEKYKLGILNEVVCIVEYRDDGSSKNMLKQYRKNPQGFSFFRIENMKDPRYGYLYKFKECIHYVSSSLILKNKDFLKAVPNKLLTVLAIPFGILLYILVMFNTRNLKEV